MTAITKLGLGGTSLSKLFPGRYDGKAIASASQTAQLVFQFDLWQEGYAGAVVSVFKEGTTEFADLFSDLNLSQPLLNPQVLLSQTINGRTFGRFSNHIYTADSYYLGINGNQTSGVEAAPLRSLDGENATEAFVTSIRGGIQRTAGERAGYSINVLDFGNFLQVDGSSAENTTTLTAAIGAAASLNGSRVMLPAGRYRVNAFNLAAEVTLAGQGRNATILQSGSVGAICTVTGDNAGLEDLTLDGLNLQPTSVGVFALARANLHLCNVMIKRFDTGLKCVGGVDHQYSNLFADNCNTNVLLRGDSDASSTALGSSFTDLIWNGGAITTSLQYGLRISYVDLPIQGLTIRDLDITDNAGTSALSIEGAKSLIIEDTVFLRNTLRHLLTSDVVPFGGVPITVENLELRSCEFTDSEIKLGGSCKDTVFDRPILAGALSINANGPLYPIMFRDAIEASTVTQTGNTDHIMRWASTNQGIYRGQTTPTATNVVVYKRVLNPGEIVHFDVMATAVQTNLALQGSIKKTGAAYLPAAALNFVNQTVSFLTGNTITAAPSGASAMIQTQTDAGPSGTLNLIRIDGVFANNDVLTSPGGGNGVAQGSITLGNAATIAPVQTDHYALPLGATTWDVDVTTSGQEARVVVRGPTTGTIDWRVAIRQNLAK